MPIYKIALGSVPTFLLFLNTPNSFSFFFLSVFHSIFFPPLFHIVLLTSPFSFLFSFYLLPPFISYCFVDFTFFLSFFPFFFSSFFFSFFSSYFYHHRFFPSFLFLFLSHRFFPLFFYSFFFASFLLGMSDQQFKMSGHF